MIDFTYGSHPPSTYTSTIDVDIVVCPATLSFDLMTATSSFLQPLLYVIGEGEKQFTFNTTDVFVSDSCATGTIELYFTAAGIAPASLTISEK